MARPRPRSRAGAGLADPRAASGRRPRGPLRRQGHGRQRADVAAGPQRQAETAGRRPRAPAPPRSARTNCQRRAGAAPEREVGVPRQGMPPGRRPTARAGTPPGRRTTSGPGGPPTGSSGPASPAAPGSRRSRNKRSPPAPTPTPAGRAAAPRHDRPRILEPGEVLGRRRPVPEHPVDLLVQPAFHRERIAGDAAAMVAAAERMLDGWEAARPAMRTPDMTHLASRSPPRASSGRTSGRRRRGLRGGRPGPSTLRRRPSFFAVPWFVPTPKHLRSGGGLRRLRIARMIAGRRAAGDRRRPARDAPGRPRRGRRRPR